MILTFIFRATTMTAVHTAIVAGIADSMDRENPLAVRLTSFAVGIPALLVGAFAEQSITSKPSPEKHDTEYDQKRAYIGGLVGYAAGSAVGFFIKHS